MLSLPSGEGPLHQLDIETSPEASVISGPQRHSAHAVELHQEEITSEGCLHRTTAFGVYYMQITWPLKASDSSFQRGEGVASSVVASALQVKALT